MIQTIIKRWSSALREKHFSLNFISIVLYLLGIGFITPKLFLFVQERNGFYPADVVLKLLSASDCSVVIFSILYSAIMLSLLYLVQKPNLLLTGIGAYAILTTLRCITLVLIPLEAPASIIPLKDPVVDRFFYDQVIITKDLFFSGHTSILFLLFLLVEPRGLKAMLLVASLSVASLLLLQHAHYTIDVIAAPFFSYLAYCLANIWLKRFTYRHV